MLRARAGFFPFLVRAKVRLYAKDSGAGSLESRSRMEQSPRGCTGKHLTG